MKEYNIYAVGNALVDMEFEVTPSFLKKMEIEKGQMTLVDVARQSYLINQLVGSQRTRSCGGSAANTVIGLTQFGGKAFYSCRVGNDESGDFFLDNLLENGVKSNLATQRRLDGVTGKCLVFITPDAERTMNTCLGISESFSEEDVVETELLKAEYLYIEGYLVTSPTARKAAIAARKIAEKNGIKTAITFSDPSMVSYFKKEFMEMMGPKVDLLFCNENEALTFTGEKDIHLAANKIREVAKTFAITLGAKGALIYDGTREIAVVTKKVQAVDANGAGDLFAGAFLYAITHGHSYIGAGRLACNAASVLVSQFGPRLRQEQATDIKAEIFGN